MADQSDTLNAQLANAAKSKVPTVAPKAGTYPVDHTVFVPAGVTFDLSAGVELVQLTEGRELTYPRDKSYDVGLRARAVLDVAGHVIGGTVRGTNAASAYVADLEAQHGLRVHDGGTIEATKVRNVWGDGAYASGANVHLAHLDVIGTGRMGVGCSNVTGLRLSDSTFDRIARSIIDLEPQATINEQILDVLISRCHFGSFGLGFAGGVGGSVIGSGGSGYVEGVAVEDCAAAGPFFVNVGTAAIQRLSYAVRRCTGGGTWNKPVFTFTNIDGVTVDACRQAYAAAKAGLDLPAVKTTGCTTVDITSCEFPGATAQQLAA